MTITFLMLQEVVVSQGRKWRDDTIARCEDATIKYYICCWLQGWQEQALSIARMMAMCIPFYVILQGAPTTNDGWLQQRRACQATTNQTLRCIPGVINNRETTTSLMRWSQPMLCHKRLQHRQQWIIATSTRDHASDNQPFSSMWISHINNCKGAKH